MIGDDKYERYQTRRYSSARFLQRFRAEDAKPPYPEIGDAIASLKERLKLYEKTGNLEHLIDVGNFAMIEYMHPRHPNAHFEAQDSDKSPGVVGGSYKQMVEEMGGDVS